MAGHKFRNRTVQYLVDKEYLLIRLVAVIIITLSINDTVARVNNLETKMNLNLICIKSKLFRCVTLKLYTLYLTRR